MIKQRLILGRLFEKSINVIHHINRREKNHITSSTDTEIASDKMQLQIKIKTLSKFGLDENFN